MKRSCRSCFIFKPLEDFPKRGQGQYRPDCKSCYNKKKKAEYIAHPRELKYHSEEERKEAARERSKLWYRNNTERAKKRISDWQKSDHGKAKIKAQRDRSKKENPEYWRHKKKRDKAIRRARERDAGSLEVSSLRVLEQNNLQTYQGSGFTCEYCGLLLGDCYHLEHRTPLSRGGTNELRNLAISCSSCNLSKLTKTDEEWRTSAPA